LFSLSKESENSLNQGILKLIADFLKVSKQPTPRQLGLMTPRQIKEELGITARTLQRWESAGLRRYQPPVEDTRKVFYRVSDILIFLGVENGKV
jgi:phage protein